MFLFLVGYDPEVLGIPSARRCTPSSKEKKLLKHNKSLKAENKNMKKELQMLKDEVSACNLKLLVEARDKFDEIRP